MIALSWEEFLIIATALAAGGLTKGLTGMGLPSVSIPIMASVLGVQRAVLTLIIPIVVSNLWLSWANRDCRNDVPELPRLLLFGLPGAAAGAGVLYLASEQMLATLLAVWIAAYLLLRLAHPNFSLSGAARRRYSPAVGVTAGALQAATGISAPVLAPYLDALGLSPRSYVFAVATAFAALAGTHLMVLLIFRAYSLQQLFESSLAVIPALLFVPIGSWLREFLPIHAFGIVIRILLLVMAVRLIIGAWFSG